jgi:hypothetical protein
MYRNQYIVVSRNTKLEPLELNAVNFDELIIYSHPSLNVSIVENGSIQLALIGYVINPLYPNESNGDIIAKLANICTTIDEFLKEVQVLSGRYVMLFKNATSFIVTGDTCHLRQMYYGFPDESFFLTSSPRLFLDVFNFEPQISKEKMAFLNKPLFFQKESTWYGDEYIDDRLKKILPNHYLDLNKKEKKRIPIIRASYSNEEQIIEYASLILRNTLYALTNRYKVMQPLTAGLDSRILLAASRSIKEKIQFYVFDLFVKNAPDIWVPDHLNKKLNLNLKIVKPGDLRSDFLDVYKKEHLFPRILPKTAHLQYHYDSKYSPDTINVNGNCAEITRLVYGYTTKKISLDMLLTFSKYQGKIPYFNEQSEKWFIDAGPYAEEYGISLMDLFYWEHRIGNWHALWPFEQDIAMEEISPFNNRSLINALFQVKPKRRRSPNYPFFYKLTEHLWKDVLSEPVNPGGYIKKVIEANSSIKYLSIKTKLLLNMRSDF